MIERIVLWVLTLKERLSEERGQDVLEYAVLGGTVAIGILGGVLFFSGAVDTWFRALGAWFTGISP